MNGTKARALRKQAAGMTDTMGTGYQTEERRDSRGFSYTAYKNPRALDEDCHRAVYQKLKQEAV